MIMAKVSKKKLPTLYGDPTKTTRGDIIAAAKMKRGGKKKTTKKKTKKKGPTPTNPSLYARVKAEAKRKFKVYPSAYANAWLVRTYKKRGGGYK